MTARPAPSGAPWRSTAAPLVVAALGAAILPGARPGIGFALIALASAAVIAAARPRRLDAPTMAIAVFAVVLVALPSARDARWLVVVDVIAALPLASYALAGGRTWAEVGRGLVAASIRLPAVPRFLLGPLGPIAGRARTRLSPIARGTVFGLALVTVFGALFASADRVFAHIATNVLTPTIDVQLVPLRITVFAALALGIGALVLTGPRYAVYAPTSRPAGSWSAIWGATRDRGRFETPDWGIPLALLNALFAAFVVLQFAVLFGGHDHVLRTAGLTYSEYARQGFFQLLIVSGLTLLVIAAVGLLADVSAVRARLLARVLSVLLCLLTLVVLASALRRLTLYEQAYGFTQARLGAHAVAVWLSGVFAMTIAAAVVARTSWLPVALVIFTAAAPLAFNAVDPEALIARENVERYRTTGKIDAPYLSTLSADAVPALLELPEPLRACVLAPIAARLEEGDAWTGWNVARARARGILASADVGECGQ